MVKLTTHEREQFEHSLNKLDWFTKLAAANTRFASQGVRLKTDGFDPTAEIYLPNKVLAFLVAAGRAALADGGRDAG